MKWRGRRTSDNIADVRGSGGGMRRAGGIGGLGVILLFVASMIFGVDLTGLAGLVGGGAPAPQSQSGPNVIDDETEEFVAVVLADTESVWTREFAERGGRYVEPTLVLFSGAVASACGSASSAVGPFYCPGDQRVYLDTDFFATLERDLGARGEFARAYVIAHEVGHHVQNLIGVMEKTMAARMRRSEAEANAISVRTELQADCFAGVWARELHEREGVLERGDIESALDAAARIGDDALQRRSQGYVVPDSFTHGTSEQRRTWFYRGFETGEMEACDTFAAGAL
ncbi:MAG: neutral zinc metallopeptidase [Rubrimonas sp.]|uniref:KPN_02809 family neutral zinc metallopeptidase n=1 Tax=Rubrimonas sp. TaxID=2036015 RepID=UPI002FDD37E1